MTTRASLPSQGGFVIHAQELQEAQELREAHSCGYAYSWRFENGRRMCMDKQTEGGRLQTLGHCTNPTRSKGRAVKTTTLIPHEARVLGRDPPIPGSGNVRTLCTQPLCLPSIPGGPTLTPFVLSVAVICFLSELKPSPPCCAEWSPALSLPQLRSGTTHTRLGV